MEPRLMTGMPQQPLCCGSGPKPPRAPRTALLVHAIVALLAVVAGLASVALAGGVLVDARTAVPAFRVGAAADPAQETAGPTPQRTNVANVESSRPSIVLRAAASTKLASKLLRASA
jgi:hypothetical protein